MFTSGKNGFAQPVPLQAVTITTAPLDAVAVMAQGKKLITHKANKMNTSEGLRWRLEIDSFNSVYLISTWHEHPYIYLKSENLDRLYRFNTNTEKLYKWVDAYSSWDTVEAKLIYVQSDSVWDYRMNNKPFEYYGD